MLVVVNLVVITGMLVVIPLGLRLLDLPRIARWWPCAALPAAAACWLPRGLPALLLSLPYAVATLFLAVVAARRLTQALRRGGGSVVREIAMGSALAYPAVAGVALVAERGGFRLFGFSLKILALTVAHFHFAGFAAALIAGLLAGAAPGTATTLAAVTVPFGTFVVLVGHFAGDWVEFAGALVLTAGMWLVGLVTWRELGGGWLLRVSAGVLAVTMVLAVEWSLGQATGLPHLSLTWMAATHGVCNACGFALCGLLGWTRIRRMG
jgi:hypothetical protein